MPARSAPITAEPWMLRPFTRAQGEARGLPAWAFRTAQLRRITQGVYVHASVPPHPLLLVVAMLLIHPPEAFASGISAARVHGVPLPRVIGEQISVLRPVDRRTRAQLRSVVAADDEDVVVLRGVRSSGAARMFVELAGTVSLVDLVVVGDDLVRRGRTTPNALVARADRAGGRHARLARRAARLVRSGVDSPMETRLRLLLVLAGLPEPQVNHVVDRGDGRTLRFDLCYPELKVIVEYDGRQHRDDLDQWDTDIARREWMDRNGWLLVVVVARDVYQRPGATIRRVREALVHAGAAPGRQAEDWRAFFAA